MSLDVFVACAASVMLPAHLPAGETWTRHDTGSFTALHVNESWVLEVWLVDDPKALGDFDLPTDAKWVVGFSLQGDNEKGLPLLEKTVDAIAKSCDGMLLDI